ncbi:MAG: IPTL-CTERM sorting domain-containing protein [Acidobacteriota bacterium]
MRQPLVLSTLLASMALLAEPASAVRLFGTTATIGPTTSDLVELDPTTGALVGVIGPIGYRVVGLAWDDTTSTLYGVTSINDAIHPGGLLIIDPTTGAATEVGSGSGLPHVATLAAATDGTLYGWSGGAGIGVPGDLVRWDKAVGTAVVLNNETIFFSMTYGLAFDLAGTLHFVNQGEFEIFAVNTSTGDVTSAGPLPNESHHGDVNPDDGLYYGIEGGAGVGSTRNLAVLDLSGPSLSQLIPTIDDLHVVEFLPDDLGGGGDMTIPTLGEWGLILMGILLALGGVVVVRRGVA